MQFAYFRHIGNKGYPCTTGEEDNASDIRSAIPLN
jgi:hypothetical protein